MKIAIVAQPWDSIAVPFRQGSTISIVARNLAAGLPSGSDTYIFAGRSPTQLERERVSQDIQVIRFASPAKPVYQLLDRVTGFWDLEPPFFASRWYYRSYYQRVANALQAISPDVVLLFTAFQFAPMLRRHLPSARIVLRMADDRLGSLPPRPELLDELDRVDVIAGNSNYTVGRIRDNIPRASEKCRVLHNGVDVDFFKPLVAPATVAEDGRVILFVGRVSPEKGLHVLLEAFDSVLAAHPDCVLHIVGQPGLLPYAYHVGLSPDPVDRGLTRFYGRTLRQKIQRQLLKKNSSYMDDLRGLLTARTAGRVRFLGAVPYAELPEVYSRATVFAIPSVINEPFGNPLAEAMACGLPVVATNGGGFRELVEHERSGLLVERNNASELARAISRLLDEPATAKRLGVTARSRIVSSFTWRHSAATLLSLSVGDIDSVSFPGCEQGGCGGT